MDWLSRAGEWLWLGAIVSVPLALLVSCASRAISRPATRHMMWAAVLISFLTPAVGLSLWRHGGEGVGRAWGATKSAAMSLADSVAPAGPAGNAKERAASAGTAEAAPARSAAPVPVDTGLVVRERTDRSQTMFAFDKTARLEREQTVSEFATTDLGPCAEIKCGDTNLKCEKIDECPPCDPCDPCAPSLATDGDVADGNGHSTGTAERSGIAGLVAPIASALQPRVWMRPLKAAASWGYEGLTDWMGRVGDVRDAIARLDPPWALWLGGSVLVLTVGLARLWKVRRVLKGAHAADPALALMVREACTAIGVQEPRTVVVDAAVSPMVCCWARPRLVIPRGLWGELDESSRRAVLVHELAHLKRRDHWLSWVQWMVGVLYWWHPVAWWVRKRIQDEAEASCDAWVTALLPGARKAYAEALVAARCFVGVSGVSPVHQLGVVSGRSARLSRRITVVMTQRVAPRASAIGVCGALLIGLIGVAATPGLACPPEEKTKAAKAKAEKDAQCATTVIVAPKAAKAAKAPKAKSADPFMGEAPALEAMGGARSTTPAPSSSGGAGEAAIKRLEDQLQSIEKALQEIERQMERRSRGQRGAVSPISPFGMSALAAPVPATQPLPPTPPTPPTSPTPATPAAFPTAPVAPVWMTTPVPAMAPTPAAPGCAAPCPTAEPAVAPTEHSHNHHHSAHAEHAQHSEAIGLAHAPCTSEASPFGLSAAVAGMPSLSMTNLADGQNLLELAAVTDEGAIEARPYKLSGGKLKALTDLMARDDVPIFIERGNDSITVRATPSQHRVFAAFVRLIDPASAAPMGVAGAAAEEAQRAMAVDQQRQALTHAGLAKKELERALKQIEREQKNAEREADRMRERAEKELEARERALESLDAIRDRAAAANDDSVRLRMLETLKAREDEAQARERAAQDLFSAADSAQDAASHLEARLAELESRLQSLEERLDELNSMDDQGDEDDADEVMP